MIAIPFLTVNSFSWMVIINFLLFYASLAPHVPNQTATPVMKSKAVKILETRLLIKGSWLRL